MHHTIILGCSPPHTETWRVVVDVKELIAFEERRAHELAESSRRDIEYFFATDRSEIHDTTGDAMSRDELAEAPPVDPSSTKR